VTQARLALSRDGNATIVRRMADRVHNFNAGPAALPLPALERAQAELLDFEGTGMSILEHSHRGKDYERVQAEAIERLRRLASIPESHEVLLLQGGATQQFATVPMNFLRADQSADYVVTGAWGEKAVEEASIVGRARVAASTDVGGAYGRVPTDGELSLDPAAAYVHYTTNETIHGLQFHHVPKVSVPLVADMSSDFLWRKVDLSQYALVYAGAQKNIGPSGLVIVIVDKAFLATARNDIPKIFRYQTHAKAGSLYNTIPTFSVYLMRNVLTWLEDLGGLDAIERENRRKATRLYDALDAAGGFYRMPVEKASRSFMNVVFRLPTEELEAALVNEAKKQRMVGIKGHRSVGGIRASIYNAVPYASVDALASLVTEFARKNG
jgi:phosphoserine aminotransferase